MELIPYIRKSRFRDVYRFKVRRDIFEFMEAGDGLIQLVEYHGQVFSNSDVIVTIRQC